MSAATRLPPAYRIGIDLGGTKIAGVVMGTDGAILKEARVASPRNDYAATITAIGDMVATLEHALPSDQRTRASIGIGMPGSISPATGLVQNANSTWINAQPFGRDLEAALGRPVRLANDANCFALSEAIDGAGIGANTVFGVIIGTGCGGAIVHRGRLLDGPHGIAGEWGHCPLPWLTAAEFPGPVCWCGRANCLELWISGSGLARDYAAASGLPATGEEIVTRAETGERAAIDALARHTDRLARGLAMIIEPDRSRRDRARRRPLEAGPPLSRRARPHARLHADRPAEPCRPSAAVGRCQRCSRRRTPLGLTAPLARYPGTCACTLTPKIQFMRAMPQKDPRS